MNNLEVLKSGIEGFGLEASDKKLQNFYIFYVFI